MQPPRRFLYLLWLVVAVTLGCSFAAAAPTAVPTETPVPPPTDTATPVPSATPTPTNTLPPPTATETETPIPPTTVADKYQYVALDPVDTADREIASIALSADGSLLAYGNYTDKSIYVIDTATGEEVWVLEGHTAAVTALAFNPDASLLASTGTVNLPPDVDGSVRLWDLATGQQSAQFSTGGVDEMVFSPDGALLAAAGGGDPMQIVLWDAETNVQQRVLSDVFTCAAFSPDGSLLAGCGRNGEVSLWEVASGQRLAYFEGFGLVMDSVAFSPDGALLAGAGWDNTILVWDVETGAEVTSFRESTGGVQQVFFSPDGLILASVGNGLEVTQSGNNVNITFASEHPLRLWDVETGDEIFTVEGAISAVAFSADWSLLAVNTSTGIDLYALP